MDLESKLAELRTDPMNTPCAKARALPWRKDLAGLPEKLKVTSAREKGGIAAAAL